MVANASQKISLKPSKLTNLWIGQLLLGKGNKGSLAVLNSCLSQEIEGVKDFPPLVASTDRHQGWDQDPEQDQDQTLSGDKADKTSEITGDSSTPPTWAERASKDHSKCFQSKVPMMEHTPQVHPVFVHYKKVSSEGYCTPLIDVAVAAGKSVGEANVDTVQPTKNGWQIYMKIEVDWTTLLATGLDLAGKLISLESHSFSISSPMVKIVVKDLSLHKVTNEDVLEAVKQVALVMLAIKYANIWIDGRQTYLRNGD